MRCLVPLSIEYEGTNTLYIWHTCIIYLYRKPANKAIKMTGTNLAWPFPTQPSVYRKVWGCIQLYHQAAHGWIRPKSNSYDQWVLLALSWVDEALISSWGDDLGTSFIGGHVSSPHSHQSLKSKVAGKSQIGNHNLPSVWQPQPDHASRSCGTRTGTPPPSRSQLCNTATSQPQGSMHRAGFENSGAHPHADVVHMS